MESGLDNISSFTDRPSLPRRVGESTEYVTTIRRYVKQRVINKQEDTTIVTLEYLVVGILSTVCLL